LLNQGGCLENFKPYINTKLNQDLDSILENVLALMSSQFDKYFGKYIKNPAKRKAFLALVNDCLIVLRLSLFVLIDESFFNYDFSWKSLRKQMGNR
jgi:hypothetical protein